MKERLPGGGRGHDELATGGKLGNRRYRFYLKARNLQRAGSFNGTGPEADAVAGCDVTQIIKLKPGLGSGAQNPKCT